MKDRVFATALNCMDGRTQIPVNQYVRDKTGADFVDTITGPGIVKELAAAQASEHAIRIKSNIEISVEKHGSGNICIAAHADCAGNPVEDEEQILQAKTAVKTLQGWFPQCAVFGVWVDLNGKVLEIAETKAV